MNKLLVFVLVGALFCSCKMHQPIFEENGLGIYNKKNKCLVFVHFMTKKDSISITSQDLLFIARKVPKIGKLNKNRERFDLNVFPVVKDNNSREGLYAYSITSKYKGKSLYAIKYTHGEPHSFFFWTVDPNHILFFSSNKKKNIQYLDHLSKHTLYKSILQYRNELVDNNILID
ncbi:hypothetical protein [Xanthocytophaga agilis]|uniref:Lipoprotein n=1 Tax=Xanthocytophaga agilis TaxID=3048010 RepID=A0AAE3R7I8_9BACT|nr:hypothetical protein [Xanthocytophaga agilis]MDJ1505184.1 hypothetical protein [Xanthocytophaga agilis]